MCQIFLPGVIGYGAFIQTKKKGGVGSDIWRLSVIYDISG